VRNPQKEIFLKKLFQMSFQNNNKKKYQERILYKKQINENEQNLSGHHSPEYKYKFQENSI
jgi:hypothetical protein